MSQIIKLLFVAICSSFILLPATAAYVPILSSTDAEKYFMNYTRSVSNAQSANILGDGGKYKTTANMLLVSAKQQHQRRSVTNIIYGNDRAVAHILAPKIRWAGTEVFTGSTFGMIYDTYWCVAFKLDAGRWYIDSIELVKAVPVGTMPGS